MNRIYFIEMPAGVVIPAGREIRKVFRGWLQETGPKETSYGFAFYRRTRDGEVVKASFAVIAPSWKTALKIAEKEWTKLKQEEEPCFTGKSKMKS